MKAKQFVRCVGQFGLPCIEQQHQRCMKSFTLFWCVLLIALCSNTIYQLEGGGTVWIWLGLDSFASIAFLFSAWQRYQLHCFISLYRQKHPQASPVRSFSGY